MTYFSVIVTAMKQKLCHKFIAERLVIVWVVANCMSECHCKIFGALSKREPLATVVAIRHVSFLELNPFHYTLICYQRPVMSFDMH